MASEIDQRTRHNHEAAMLHNDRLIAGHINQAPQKGDFDAWVWPMAADAELQGEREAAATGGQLPAPHSEAIDRAAYDRFMRSLG
jgi:hypothetical protein